MTTKIDINTYTDDTSIDTVINNVVGGGRSRQLIVHVHPLTNRVQYTVKECLYFDTFQEAVKSYNEAEADYRLGGRKTK